MIRVVFAWAVALVLMAGSGASAQAPYPSRPIHFILPQPAGGAVDLVARALASRLSESLGQPVVVENVPGANGSLAAARVARSAPDGYTLFMAVDTNLVVNPSLYPTLAYDPFRDFAPIGVVVRLSNVLAVKSSLPVRTVQEFVDLSKARPGKLNYASVGNGAVQHLGMELFKAKTGADLTHVPYKGMAPALTDLIAGNVDAMFTGTNFAAQQSEKLRSLAIGGPRRSPLLPDVPSMPEAGVAGFDITTWEALLAPVQTPPDVIALLSAELAKAAAHPAFRRVLETQDFEVVGSTPGELLAAMRADTAKWGEVIRNAGVRPE